MEIHRGNEIYKEMDMNDLIKWKNKKNKKPLVIRGARQVGKKWLMKRFGETSYEKTVYISFDNNQQMKELFDKDMRTERIIIGIELYSGHKINPSISVRTAMLDYKKDDWLINIPLWAIEAIENEVHMKTNFL